MGQLYQTLRSDFDNRRLILLHPKVGDFFQYVENQWIQGTPVGIWNVFNREGNARTTNMCEGWNSTWKNLLEKNNRNIWGVVMALKYQEKSQKVKFRKTEQGETPPPQRRKYRELNMKIQRLKEALQNNFISVSCYWTNISLNCRPFYLFAQYGVH